MEAIKKNLKDQILTDDKTIMFCSNCEGSNSANSGDYWDYPENHAFKCCGETMTLVTQETIFTPI